MSIPHTFMMLCLLIYNSPIAGRPTNIHHITLSAQVYAVPPIQGMRVGTLENSTVSAVNVTTNFPDGIVLISTDILGLERDEQIENRIRATLRRGGAKLPWVGEIGLIRAYPPFQGEPFTLEGGSIRNQLKVIEGDLRGKKFKLMFSPLESSESELIAKIRFEEARRSSHGGEIYITLLDRTFGIPLSRVYLIGFPSMKGRAGSTVYWIVVVADPHAFDRQ